MIYGLGIYNMKGALVCYTQAVKALHRAGVKLDGDLLIAAVAGEIEKTQWATNSREGISRLRSRHALLGESRRCARHVHSRRTHRHASGAGPLRIHVGPLHHARHLRAHRFCQNARRTVRFAACTMCLTPSTNGSPLGIAKLLHGKQASSTSAASAPATPGAPAERRTHRNLSGSPRAAELPLAQARSAVKDFFLDLQKRFPDYGLEFETYVSVPGAQIAEKHELVEPSKLPQQ